MYSPIEFCRKTIGLPWFNRACSFERVDCWGLVVLYYRHVLDIELHQSAGYESDQDFLTCYADNVVFWEKIDVPEDNCIVIGFGGDIPVHIGLMVGNDCLHASQAAGVVRYDKLRALSRSFTKLEFMRYANHR